MKDAATAYHEAGHALLYIVQAIPLKHATIVGDRDTAGHVQAAAPISRRLLERLEVDDVTPKDRDAIERDIRSLLAGEMAQRRALPRSVRDYHGSRDRKAWITLLSALTHGDLGDEFRAYHKLLTVQTKSHLERNWWGVEAIAQALLERRTLTGEELRDCYREALTGLQRHPLSVFNVAAKNRRRGEV